MSEETGQESVLRNALQGKRLIMRNMGMPTARQCNPRSVVGRLFEPPSRFFPGPAPRHPVSLALETALVAIGTLVFLGLLSKVQAHHLQWFVVPGALTAAALVPAWITGRDFPRFGFDGDHIGLALGSLCRVCIYVLPMLFLGLWAMKALLVPIPLQPILAERENGLTWLLYQFLYVAVAEETFFRGYIQGNVMRLFDRAASLSWPARQRIVILISAACFAAAHVVVQGHILSVLTFLPGMLLAWLFIRTRSLLAPILFHGIANVAYGIMAITLA